MAFGKKNVVQVDPLRYSITLLGESKCGKTTLIYEYCKRLAGDDGYLFIETGAERGADAISGINYINAPAWNMDYDEYTNSAGFADVCEDIIENKSTDYKDLRVVVVDTYDQLIDIAEEESIRLWNKELREQGKPACKSINSAWSGFGRGEKKAMELMFDLRNRLLQVGVQTIYISHVKKKDVTDVVSGETYQTLTSDQQQNYFNALKKDMHFLALAYIDREIIKENSGKKNSKGQEIKVGRVTGESRRIKFRDDNYAVDSGSRFADIEADIPMNVDAFIEAITDAIKAEAEKGEKSVEDLKKEQDKAAKKHEKEIAEAIASNKVKKELETVISSIIDACKADKDLAKNVVKECKELGYSNPKEVDELEVAKKLLAMCE